MSILIKNIKDLIQARDVGFRVVKGPDMKVLHLIENAYLLIENGLVMSLPLMLPTGLAN